MDFKELLNQKQKEREALEVEIKKIDNYRLEIMSRILKAEGALDAFRAILKAEDEAKPKPPIEEPTKVAEPVAETVKQ